MTDTAVGYLEHLFDPTLGSHRDGEIEILTSPDVLQGAFREWATAKGRRPPYVGVLYEDEYVALVRDPVQFPSGDFGDYIRVIPKPLDTFMNGVLVIPFDGEKMCFISTFRHATRAWEIELPRGGIEANESIQSAAKRELKQETGLAGRQVRELGVLCPDTGLIGSAVRVCIAEVSGAEDSLATPELSEAVAGKVWLSKEEYEEQLREGALRDAMSIAAIAVVRANGIWS